MLTMPISPYMFTVTELSRAPKGPRFELSMPENLLKQVPIPQHWPNTPQLRIVAYMQCSRGRSPRRLAKVELL